MFLRGTIYGSGYGKTPKVEDELKSFRLSASLPAPGFVDSLFSGVDVGLNYADREKDKHQPEAPILVGAQGDTTIASDLQYGLVDLRFAGVGFIPSWNVPGAVARYMTFDPNENAPWLISKAWSVSEKLSTGYIRANIDTGEQAVNEARSGKRGRKPETLQLVLDLRGLAVARSIDGAA